MEKSKKKNIILFILVIAIVILPLMINSKAEYGGADDAAEDAITKISPGYKPWFESIWEPPSGEIESLIFAVQASLGTGVICYYFGFLKGKKKEREESRKLTDSKDERSK